MAERRPLASRNTKWAAAAARRLAARGIRPNLISQVSVAFAALGGCAFALTTWFASGATITLLLVGALCCQGRLICNLLDGMVAVEGGLSEPDGPYWNEAPDRIADLLFLSGAGIAVGAPWLGILAGALAILTAYIRELGRAERQPVDFSGPMAKPQRMAALTLGAMAAAVETATLGSLWALALALVAITLGTAWTAFSRSRRMISALRDP